MIRRAPLSIVLAALLATPALAWRSDGAVEPDTEPDAAAHMWHDAPSAETGRRAYLNVVALATARASGQRIDVNPNGPAQTGLAPTSISFHAWLGEWKDCNGDGYVGMANGALWAYRAELVGNEAYCPAGTEENRDGWVYEFRWIYPFTAGQQGVSVIAGHSDGSARVWGDFGKPGDAPRFACELTPVPVGVMRSTGGLLAFAGCHTEHVVTRTLSGDEGRALGLAWEDPDRPEEDCDHPLYAQTIWGDPRCDGPPGVWERRTGRPAFEVWDCDASKEEAVLDARDPTAPPGRDGALNGSVQDPRTGRWTLAWNLTDGEGSYNWFTIPAPSADHLADGSWYDAVGRARGNRYCTYNEKSGQYGGTEYPMNSTQPNEGVLYGQGFENPGVALHPGPKRMHDVTFHFQQAALGNRSYVSLGLPTAVDAILQPVTNRTPYALGATAGLAYRDGGWISNETFDPPGWRAGLVRGDASPGAGTWFTFYASLGTNLRATLAVPAPGLGTYGSESCPVADAGQAVSANGWDCDPTRWWEAEHGAPSATFYIKRVGAPYHLRDVDCYDQTVTTVEGQRVQASLAAVAEDAENACR